jgi:hypothetical protein
MSQSVLMFFADPPILNLNSVITYGCLQRLLSWAANKRSTLKSKTLSVLGEPSGAVADSTSGNPGTDLATLVHSVIQHIDSAQIMWRQQTSADPGVVQLKLKSKLPQVCHLSRAVRTALSSSPSNCCLIAQYLYVSTSSSVTTQPQSGAERMRALRQKDSDYRQTERLATATRESQHRAADPQFREKERLATAGYKRERRAEDPQFRQVEKVADAARKRTQNECHTVDELICQFHTVVATGPV